MPSSSLTHPPLLLARWRKRSRGLLEVDRMRTYLRERANVAILQRKAWGVARISWRQVCVGAVLWTLGCGSERPPWNGFDLFPSDGGAVDFPPELLPGVLAVLAASATSSQAAAGSGAVGATGPGAAGAVAVVSAPAQPDMMDASVAPSQTAASTPAQAATTATPSQAGGAGGSVSQQRSPAFPFGTWPPPATLPWAGRPAPSGQAGNRAPPSTNGPSLDAGVPVAAGGGKSDDADAGPR
jgi:hypothetical protein